MTFNVAVLFKCDLAAIPKYTVHRILEHRTGGNVASRFFTPPCPVVTTYMI
jgi:hypothetical protein